MKETNQEDLTMLTLLGSVRRGIRALGSAIGSLFRLFVQNIFVMALFIVSAVFISLAVYWISRPYYKSQLVMSHIRVNNDFCSRLVKILDSYIDPKENNRTLADKLQLPENLAREIRSFEYSLENDNIGRRYADSLNVVLPFSVSVEVYDVGILDTLEGSILRFFESNEYAVKRKLIDAQQMNELESRIDREIAETDSLKKLVNQGIIPRGSGNGIILGEPIDPVSVHKRGLELYDRKQFVRKKKLLNNSFEILVGFNNSVKRSSHGRLFYIAIGVILGYLSGLIYLANRNGALRKREASAPAD